MEAQVDRQLAETHGLFWRRMKDAFDIASKAAGQLADAYLKAPVVADVTANIDAPRARGPRQQDIVDLLGLRAGESGLKTSEIAKSVRMEQPNAYLALQTLQEQGLVEQVPDISPQHWRLTPRFRLSREIVEVGHLVKRGEWTSYGDISQVVYGHARAGLAVGRVAASPTSNFPNPHRVLQYTGQIPDEWRDGQGGGPEECARRLGAEGVEILDGSWAHPRSHVTHEVLTERLERKRQDDMLRERLRSVDDIDRFIEGDEGDQ
jgi:alkylated DNA nucleotide flippase Atl1